MKKEYQKPELEIITIEEADIISDSSDMPPIH